MHYLSVDQKRVPPLGWEASRDEEAKGYADQNKTGHMILLLGSSADAV